MVTGLDAVPRRHGEAADSLSKKIREGDGGSIFPEWAHDLEPHWKPGGSPADGTNGSWAAGQGRSHHPRHELHIRSLPGGSIEGPRVEIPLVLMSESGRERAGHQEDVHLLEVFLPEMTESELPKVLLLPICIRAECPGRKWICVLLVLLPISFLRLLALGAEGEGTEKKQVGAQSFIEVVAGRPAWAQLCSGALESGKRAFEYRPHLRRAAGEGTIEYVTDAALFKTASAGWR